MNRITVKAPRPDRLMEFRKAPRALQGMAVQERYRKIMQKVKDVVYRIKIEVSDVLIGETV